MLLTLGPPIWFPFISPEAAPLKLLPYSPRPGTNLSLASAGELIVARGGVASGYASVALLGCQTCPEVLMPPVVVLRFGVDS